MKPLTKDSPGVVIELFCEEEDTSYKDAMASGDDALDRETEKWIADQLAVGNAWAWCIAHVRVTFRDTLIADDYLGACSYKGESDFRDGGYFDDMVSECLESLNKQRATICDCES